MAKNLFSVPIFFIVFRETLEAAIIVSVLLGIAEQLVHDDPSRFSNPVTTESDDNTSKEGTPDVNATSELPEDQRAVRHRRLIRKLRINIFVGAAIGLSIALAIGAAFIAIWFTQASNLWERAEELWEGIFGLIASLIILVMGVTMVKMDSAQVKWRVKLQRAFDKDRGHLDKEGRAGRWVLFLLPLITVMREGLEAIVFVGGISLGEPATAIPIATIVGIICGVLVGFVIYTFASRTTLRVFLIIITNFLLLIGAGMFSRTIGHFETHAYNQMLSGGGGDDDDGGGTGPGTYPVKGNVWHLDCCETPGWTLFGAIFGWVNNGSVGSVLAYVFYWLAVVVLLIGMKAQEGRLRLGRNKGKGRAPLDQPERESAEKDPIEVEVGPSKAA